MGKRHVSNVYPIGGLRWMNEDGINEQDGLLFSLQRAGTASDRSLISNDQRMIKWEKLKIAIAEQVVIPTIQIDNIAHITSDFTLPVYQGTDDQGKFEFDSIGEGLGVVLTAEAGYIKISLKTYEDSGYPLPVLYEFQRNALTNMVEGGLIYNRDSKQLNWWTGVEWKSTNA